MASIIAITTNLPEHSLQVADLPHFTKLWFGEDEAAVAKFLKLCGASGVETRYFAVPYQDAVGLRGLEQRSSLYREIGTHLLAKTQSEVIRKAQLLPEELATSIFSSCSVPTLPALDVEALFLTGLSPSIFRIPLFQHGCIGGVVGLSLASRLAEQGQNVLVSSVELCSLVFQPADKSMGQLVGSAIFADGAGAMILSPKPGLARIAAAQSFLVPDSTNLIGYTLLDDGLHLRLDKALPEELSIQLPRFLKQFLYEQQVVPEDIKYWLLHPGGKRILDLTRDAFSITTSQLQWSYDALRNIGNTSSSAIYFVMQSFFESKGLKRGEKALVVGMGPGLTIEAVLLEGEL